MGNRSGAMWRETKRKIVFSDTFVDKIDGLKRERSVRMEGLKGIRKGKGISSERAVVFDAESSSAIHNKSEVSLESQNQNPQHETNKKKNILRYERKVLSREKRPDVALMGNKFVQGWPARFFRGQQTQEKFFIG